MRTAHPVGHSLFSFSNFGRAASLVFVAGLLLSALIFPPGQALSSVKHLLPGSLIPAISPALQDAHTLLYLSFDNTLNGANGETPTMASGTSYEPGIAGSGVSLPNDNQLFYQSAGNIDAKEGTFECWLKPAWNGNDGQTHAILQYGVSGGMLIAKDGANNLRIILNRFGGAGGSEAGVAYNVSSWTAGQWHHLAFVWSNSSKTLKLYIDGTLKSQAGFSISLPAISSSAFQLGADGAGSYLNAVIDEVRISDIERTAEEIAADFLQHLTVSSWTFNPPTTAIEMYPGWSYWEPLTINAVTNVGNLSLPLTAATWTSSNPGVAVFDPSGRIKGLSPGTATLTATLGGQSRSIAVTILQPARPPVEESIDPYLATPAAGYLMKTPVVILRYFPTRDGVNLDAAASGDNSTLADVKARMERLEKQHKFMLEEGSRFRGYEDPQSLPALGYQIVKIVTVYEDIPPGFATPSPGVYFPDYQQILARFGGESLVNNFGVKEFWIEHYHHGRIAPNESNMSSPVTGDISNSYRTPGDLPVYQRSYVAYGINFSRSANEATHNHGHQLEAILSHVNQLQDGNTTLFWNQFSGTQHPAGRCGNTHFPPNGTSDYDYNNPTPVQSDCEDWTPANTGQKKPTNNQTWGSLPYQWPDGIAPGGKTEAQYYIYWMQNMPGRGNVIPHGGNRMSNWWAFTGDWDASIRAGLGLYEPGTCAWTISATSQTVDANGGSGSVNVTCGSGCKWTASSNAEWITLNGNPFGAGNGSINFTAAPNPGPGARTGTIAIAGQTFTVTQSAPALLPSGTITVNTTADTVANDGFCSLREAIIAANTNTASGALAGECAAGQAGQDTIQFSIGSGTPSIAVTGSSLPDIAEPVQLLGNTGGATRIELNGAGAGANADGLSITAGNSLIRSLVINRFSGNGINIESAGRNIITGCYIGTDVNGAAAMANQRHGIFVIGAPGNTIGGEEAGTGNVISGNGVRGIEALSPDTRIIGNYIGTNAAGDAALPNGATGMVLYNQNNIVGGTTAAARNLISGNSGAGIALFGNSSKNNLVAGNYIGTNADGAAAIPNHLGGIEISFGASNNIIGGTTPGARNLISGNQGDENISFGDGVLIDGFNGNTNGNRVQGNYIGTNAAGSAAIPNEGNGVFSLFSSDNLIGGTEAGARNLISGNMFSGVGIQVGSGNRVEGNYIGTNADGTAGIANGGGGVFVGFEASNNSIGGLAPGAGNLIAFNQFDGVIVFDPDETSSSFNVPILSNSIHSNGGLGIDLSPPVEANGTVFSIITPNDAGDGDTGPNHLQNFPVLSSAVVAGGQLTINGSLNSEANKTYLIQFFACAACDSASRAEGQTLIGQTTLTTDGSGNASFAPAFPLVVPDGRIITATATLMNGGAAERQENANADTPTDTSEFAAGIAACVAPTITQQPLSRTLQVGSAVSFTVAAEGTGPLAYQWRKDGVNIQGATGSAYSIPVISATSAGKYDVIVTGACGTVTSAQAMLTVTRAATTTTVASAPNPSLPGTTVSLTAMVSSAVTALGSPTGTVTFRDGNTVLGTAPLNAGKAIFTTSALAPGAHQIAAEYNGDLNFNGSVGNLVHRVLRPEDILTVKLTDPFACTSEGSTLGVTAQVINPNAVALPFEFTATMPPELLALAGSCQTTSGACAVSPGEVRVSGQIGANQSITISYKVQVRDDAQAGADFCIASVAGFDTDRNGSFELSVRINECERIDCPNTDSGVRAATESPLSDQKAGSVLIFNFYTSSANNPTIQNTRINLTNTDQARTVSVHLFFVDGSDCSVADSVLCLSQNQTTSLLASDIDPGVTGYLIVVAVDGATGCPISFNRLMGDAYIKLPGWQTNLSAVAISALSGAPLACDAGSNTATLNFDGVSYNRIPRTLAVSNLASPLDGNAPLLILNRIGGSLATGLSRLESVFGILFDDTEHPFSFSFTGGCQFRAPLNNNFPRTTPRLGNVIPVGHTGWMKLWTTEDSGLLGAIINANPQAATNQNAFSHGHNLHALTFTSTASLTLPVHLPGCN